LSFPCFLFYSLLLCFCFWFLYVRPCVFFGFVLVAGASPFFCLAFGHFPQTSTEVLLRLKLPPCSVFVGWAFELRLYTCTGALSLQSHHWYPFGGGKKDRRTKKKDKSTHA
jgi:hypothetical protein